MLLHVLLNTDTNSRRLLENFSLCKTLILMVNKVGVARHVLGENIYTLQEKALQNWFMLTYGSKQALETITNSAVTAHSLLMRS